MNTITKRIDPALLDGKEPLATGYKVFDWDWTGHNDYCYADDDGNVEGSVHTVTGNISECAWGLHYCLNPLDCIFQSTLPVRGATEDRFNEVWNVLDKWQPDFTNAQELKAKYGNDKWKQTPAPAITDLSAKEVYAEMPDELREYIKSMPEYDDEIFRAITEAEA